MIIQNVSQILIILMQAKNGRVFHIFPKLHPFRLLRKAEASPDSAGSFFQLNIGLFFEDYKE
jgi:hypothetical protein